MSGWRRLWKESVQMLDKIFTLVPGFKLTTFSMWAECSVDRAGWLQDKIPTMLPIFFNVSWALLRPICVRAKCKFSCKRKQQTMGRIVIDTGLLTAWLTDYMRVEIATARPRARGNSQKVSFRLFPRARGNSHCLNNRRKKSRMRVYVSVCVCSYRWWR